MIPLYDCIRCPNLKRNNVFFSLRYKVSYSLTRYKVSCSLTLYKVSCSPARYNVYRSLTRYKVSFSLGWNGCPAP